MTSGNPSIDAAIIVGFATIIGALLGVIGIMLGLIHKTTKKTNRNSMGVLEQVQNSHETNMRDDLDDKFAGLATLTKSVISTQETQGKDLGGIKADIRQIHLDQTSDRATAAAQAAAAALSAATAVNVAQKALGRTRPRTPALRRPTKEKQ